MSKYPGVLLQQLSKSTDGVSTPTVRYVLQACVEGVCLFVLRESKPTFLLVKRHPIRRPKPMLRLIGTVWTKAICNGAVVNGGIVGSVL